MDPKKHILFISSWYPHRNNLTHGIFNRYFAEAVSLYHQVSVLHVCSDKALEREMEFVMSDNQGVKTLNVYYSPVSFFRPFKKYRLIIRAYREGYRRLFADAKPHLIQLNVIMPAAAGVLYLSRKHNIPFVINENWSGYTEEDGNYNGVVKKYFTRRAVRRARAIMPTSSYLMRAMQAHSLKGEYSIVPNVVNVNVFKPQQAPVSPGTTFIHISSLNDREKNVSGIIMAFSEAAATVPGLKLNIVGEGTDRPVYEKMVDNLGMNGRIVFLGRLMAQDLVNQINAAHALVMFSNYETFCLVIVEAFACGKPVITSNAGAIAGYMKPSLGIMVEKGRYEDLRDAMVTFANNTDQFDGQFIREFAVNNYSYEIVGKKLSSIYEFALGGPKPVE